MGAKERAEAIFDGGTNCAQAVLLSSLPESADEETALRMASCFGGGVSHTNHICGAVSGALMAIGTAEGMSFVGDTDAKERVADIGAEFVRRFRERFGSTQCTKLISYDLSDPEQLEAARESGIFREACPRFVAGSAEMVEKLLAEVRNG